MVFPIGAHVWELAADHLDRLPGKSLIDGLIHKSSVTNNGDAAGTEQPENGAESWSNEAKNGNSDQQSSVALRRCSAESSNDEILSVQFAKKPQAGEKQNDVEQQEGAGDQGVDAENEETSSIVA